MTNKQFAGLAYGEETRSNYNAALFKFLDWLGTKPLTPEAVQEFDQINPKNRLKRRSAIRAYCKEHKITDPYGKDRRNAPGGKVNPATIKVTTRNVYAGQVELIKAFCGVDALTRENFDAYVESRRGEFSSFSNFKAKINTCFNWYQACIEQGLDTDPIKPEHNRQAISSTTRRAYALKMDQLKKWCGKDDPTQDDVEAYIKAHKEEWGSSFRHRSTKSRTAFLWYLDALEKGVNVDFAPVISLAEIGPNTREKYAQDWERLVKSFDNVDEVTEEHVEAFIKTEGDHLMNSDHFAFRFRCAYKWTLYCKEHGLSIKRNEPTIDGLKPKLAIEYEKILKHIVTVVGDSNFTDKQALEALGDEYSHKIDLFKEALAWRDSTKDKALILRLKRVRQRVDAKKEIEGGSYQYKRDAGSSSLLFYTDHKKPLNYRVNTQLIAHSRGLGEATVQAYLRRVARFQIFIGSDKITPEGWQLFVKRGCGSASSVAREKLALQWYCIDNGLPLPFELIDVRRQKGKTYTKADRTAVKIKHNFPPCVMCDGKNVSNPRRGDLFTKICDSCYEKNYARTARHTEIEKDKQIRRDIALPPAQRIERNAVTSTTSWRRHR